MQKQYEALEDDIPGKKFLHNQSHDNDELTLQEQAVYYIVPRKRNTDKARSKSAKTICPNLAKFSATLPTIWLVCGQPPKRSRVVGAHDAQAHNIVVCCTCEWCLKLNAAEEAASSSRGVRQQRHAGTENSLFQGRLFNLPQWHEHCTDTRITGIDITKKPDNYRRLLFNIVHVVSEPQADCAGPSNQAPCNLEANKTLWSYLLCLRKAEERAAAAAAGSQDAHIGPQRQRELHIGARDHTDLQPGRDHLATSGTAMCHTWIGEGDLAGLDEACQDAHRPKCWLEGMRLHVFYHEELPAGRWYSGTVLRSSQESPVLQVEWDPWIHGPTNTRQDATFGEVLLGITLLHFGPDSPSGYGNGPDATDRVCTLPSRSLAAEGSAGGTAGPAAPAGDAPPTGWVQQGTSPSATDVGHAAGLEASNPDCVPLQLAQRLALLGAGGSASPQPSPEGHRSNGGNKKRRTRAQSKALQWTEHMSRKKHHAPSTAVFPCNEPAPQKEQLRRKSPQTPQPLPLIKQELLEESAIAGHLHCRQDQQRQVQPRETQPQPVHPQTLISSLGQTDPGHFKVNPVVPRPCSPDRCEGILEDPHIAAAVEGEALRRDQIVPSRLPKRQRAEKPHDAQDASQLQHTLAQGGGQKRPKFPHTSIAPISTPPAQKPQLEQQPCLPPPPLVQQRQGTSNKPQQQLLRQAPQGPQQPLVASEDQSMNTIDLALLLAQGRGLRPTSPAARDAGDAGSTEHVANGAGMGLSVPVHQSIDAQAPGHADKAPFMPPPPQPNDIMRAAGLTSALTFAEQSNNQSRDDVGRFGAADVPACYMGCAAAAGTTQSGFVLPLESEPQGRMQPPQLGEAERQQDQHQHGDGLRPGPAPLGDVLRVGNCVSCVVSTPQPDVQKLNPLVSESQQLELVFSQRDAVSMGLNPGSAGRAASDADAALGEAGMGWNAARSSHAKTSCPANAEALRLASALNAASPGAEPQGTADLAASAAPVPIAAGTGLPGSQAMLPAMELQAPAADGYKKGPPLAPDDGSPDGDEERRLSNATRVPTVPSASVVRGLALASGPYQAELTLAIANKVDRSHGAGLGVDGNGSGQSILVHGGGEPSRCGFAGRGYCSSDGDLEDEHNHNNRRNEVGTRLRHLLTVMGANSSNSETSCSTGRDAAVEVTGEGPRVSPKLHEVTEPAPQLLPQTFPDVLGSPQSPGLRSRRPVTQRVTDVLSPRPHLSKLAGTSVAAAAAVSSVRDEYELPTDDDKDSSSYRTAEENGQGDSDGNDTASTARETGIIQDTVMHGAEGHEGGVPGVETHPSAALEEGARVGRTETQKGLQAQNQQRPPGAEPRLMCRFQSSRRQQEQQQDAEQGTELQVETTSQLQHQQEAVLAQVDDSQRVAHDDEGPDSHPPKERHVRELVTLRRLRSTQAAPLPPAALHLWYSFAEGNSETASERQSPDVLGARESGLHQITEAVNRSDPAGLLREQHQRNELQQVAGQGGVGSDAQMVVEGASGAIDSTHGVELHPEPHPLQQAGIESSSGALQELMQHVPRLHISQETRLTGQGQEQQHQPQPAPVVTTITDQQDFRDPVVVPVCLSQPACPQLLLPPPVMMPAVDIWPATACAGATTTGDGVTASLSSGHTWPQKLLRNIQDVANRLTHRVSFPAGQASATAPSAVEPKQMRLQVLLCHKANPDNRIMPAQQFRSLEVALRRLHETKLGNRGTRNSGGEAGAGGGIMNNGELYVLGPELQPRTTGTPDRHMIVHLPDELHHPYCLQMRASSGSAADDGEKPAAVGGDGEQPACGGDGEQLVAVGGRMSSFLNPGSRSHMPLLSAGGFGALSSARRGDMAIAYGRRGHGAVQMCTTYGVRYHFPCPSSATIAGRGGNGESAASDEQLELEVQVHLHSCTIPGAAGLKEVGLVLTLRGSGCRAAPTACTGSTHGDVCGWSAIVALGVWLCSGLCQVAVLPPGSCQADAGAALLQRLLNAGSLREALGLPLQPSVQKDTTAVARPFNTGDGTAHMDATEPEAAATATHLPEVEPANQSSLEMSTSMLQDARMASRNGGQPSLEARLLEAGGAQRLLQDTDHEQAGIDTRAAAAAGLPDGISVSPTCSPLGEMDVEPILPASGSRSQSPGGLEALTTGISTTGTTAHVEAGVALVAAFQPHAGAHDDLGCTSSHRGERGDSGVVAAAACAVGGVAVSAAMSRGDANLLLNEQGGAVAQYAVHDGSGSGSGLNIGAHTLGASVGADAITVVCTHGDGSGDGDGAGTATLSVEGNGGGLTEPCLANSDTKPEAPMAMGSAAQASSETTASLEAARSIRERALAMDPMLLRSLQEFGLLDDLVPVLEKMTIEQLSEVPVRLLARLMFMSNTLSSSSTNGCSRTSGTAATSTSSVLPSSVARGASGNSICAVRAHIAAVRVFALFAVGWYMARADMEAEDEPQLHQIRGAGPGSINPIPESCTWVQPQMGAAVAAAAAAPLPPSPKGNEQGTQAGPSVQNQRQQQRPGTEYFSCALDRLLGLYWASRTVFRTAEFWEVLCRMHVLLKVGDAHDQPGGISKLVEKAIVGVFTCAWPAEAVTAGVGDSDVARLLACWDEILEAHRQLQKEREQDAAESEDGEEGDRGATEVEAPWRAGAAVRTQPLLPPQLQQPSPQHARRSRRRLQTVQQRMVTQPQEQRRLLQQQQLQGQQQRRGQLQRRGQQQRRQPQQPVVQERAGVQQQPAMQQPQIQQHQQQAVHAQPQQHNGMGLMVEFAKQLGPLPMGNRDIILRLFALALVKGLRVASGPAAASQPQQQVKVRMRCCTLAPTFSSDSPKYLITFIYQGLQLSQTFSMQNLPQEGLSGMVDRDVELPVGLVASAAAAELRSSGMALPAVVERALMEGCVGNTHLQFLISLLQYWRAQLSLQPGLKSVLQSQLQPVSAGAADEANDAAQLSVPASAAADVAAGQSSTLHELSHTLAVAASSGPQTVAAGWQARAPLGGATVAGGPEVAPAAVAAVAVTTNTAAVGTLGAVTLLGAQQQWQMLQMQQLSQQIQQMTFLVQQRQLMQRQHSEPQLDQSQQRQQPVAQDRLPQQERRQLEQPQQRAKAPVTVDATRLMTTQTAAGLPGIQEPFGASSAATLWPPICTSAVNQATMPMQPVTVAAAAPAQQVATLGYNAAAQLPAYGQQTGGSLTMESVTTTVGVDAPASGGVVSTGATTLGDIWNVA
ncbi:hypothetical protein Vretimale_1223 [Volvox reticuliferus]|uniref:Uncharacterized protein n=1 Tax=Volvox reticuliferus TaxID=1737510 RepID=A0A8J4G1N5_9CHLO|nr:hypothetical protein Vretifemale_10626 [Volvox reticuliferus]GIL95181.1 hypothetical protein Vretimale_1223 [Volvox reticuliferus]